MRKDVKIGMMIGTFLVIIFLIWFSIKKPVKQVQQSLHTKTDLNLPDKKSTDQNQTSDQLYGYDSSDEYGYLSDDNQPPLPETKPTESDKNAASDSAHEPTQQTETIHRYHTVKQGETLSSISSLYYGTPTEWKKIYDANRSILPAPQKLRPGMNLIIPH